MWDSGQAPALSPSNSPSRSFSSALPPTSSRNNRCAWLPPPISSPSFPPSLTSLKSKPASTSSPPTNPPRHSPHKSSTAPPLISSWPPTSHSPSVSSTPEKPNRTTPSSTRAGPSSSG